MRYTSISTIVALGACAAALAACGSITPVTSSGAGFQTKQFANGFAGNGAVAGFGDFGVPAFGSYGATPIGAFGGPGVGALGAGGPCGYPPYGSVYGGVFGAYPEYCSLGPVGAGFGVPAFGAVGGFGGFGDVGSPYPIGGDIYGGRTGRHHRTGRIDRQPAFLPEGIAEENDEAFRRVGSAIWERK